MWEIGLVHQLTSSAYAFLVGLFFAAVYDILKACCVVNKLNNFAVFVKDVLFSLFAFLVTFMLLMARSNGMLRGYILFWIAVGFFVFRISISKIWFKIFKFLFSKLRLLSFFVNGCVAKFSDLIDRFDAVMLIFLKKLIKKQKNL